MNTVQRTRQRALDRPPLCARRSLARDYRRRGVRAKKFLVNARRVSTTACAPKARLFSVMPSLAPVITEHDSEDGMSNAGSVSPRSLFFSAAASSDSAARSSARLFPRARRHMILGLVDLSAVRAVANACAPALSRSLASTTLRSCRAFRNHITRRRGWETVPA